MPETSRWANAFDKSMAAGPVARAGWLALVSLVTIALAATVLALTRIGPDGGFDFGEAAWQSLMRTMDAGTMGGDSGWVFRFAERVLVIGWNRRGPMIAHELSRYVKAGSVLTIAGDVPGLAEEVRAMPLGSKNMKVGVRIIDTSHAASLEALEPLTYDSIMVLGYSDHMEAQSADTRTLITLLHLRKLSERLGEHISMVSEMIDIRNRELAEVTRADDFVVSNRLVSLMLAQASENEYLSAIFDDLLDEDGAEIYMRPVGDYVDLDLPVSFYTIAEAARRRGETAIDYRRRRPDDADDGRNMGGVVVNPPKSERLSYEPEDRVIVLAED